MLGGLPFQQMAATHPAAVGYSCDGIGGKPSLVGKECDHHQRAQDLVVCALPADDGTLDAARKPLKPGRNGGNGDREPDHQAPRFRGGRNDPAEKQEQHGRDRNQAAAEIVQYAPAADEVERIAALGASAGGHVPQNPGGDLPVAANPAVLALAVAGVVERHVFKQLDIGGQTHTDVRAFDQVVAQQGFGGKSMPKALIERRDIVDGFAVKNGFAEQVLLRVGYGLAYRDRCRWCRRRCG